MCSTHHLLYFGSVHPGAVLDPPLDWRDSLFLGVIPGAFWSLSFWSWFKRLSAFLDDDCCPVLSVEEGILELCFAGLLIDVMPSCRLFAAMVVILDRWDTQDVREISDTIVHEAGLGLFYSRSRSVLMNLCRTMTLWHMQKPCEATKNAEQSHFTLGKSLDDTTICLTLGTARRYEARISTFAMCPLIRITILLEHSRRSASDNKQISREKDYFVDFLREFSDNPFVANHLFLLFLQFVVCDTS